MKETQFLIWSIEHNGWWARNERGYVKHRDKAGLYSYERALQIVRGGNFATTDVPNEAMIEFINE